MRGVHAFFDGQGYCRPPSASVATDLRMSEKNNVARKHLAPRGVRAVVGGHLSRESVGEGGVSPTAGAVAAADADPARAATDAAVSVAADTATAVATDTPVGTGAERAGAAV